MKLYRKARMAAVIQTTGAVNSVSAFPAVGGWQMPREARVRRELSQILI